MLFTKNNVSYKAVKVRVAPYDPEDSVAQNMPARTITNENDNVNNVIGYIQSNYTFERMAGFKNAKLSEAFENEVIDEVDDCDIQEWKKTADMIPSFEGDWLTTLDLRALKILLGTDFASVPGVNVTDHNQARQSGAIADYNKNYRLDMQHHDASGNIIAPVTATTAGNITLVGSTDGTLTVDTDWRIEDNGFGEFGLVVYSGGAITTLAQTFTLVYDYLPITAEYTGYDIGSTVQPYFIVEIETCPDENGKVDKFYIVKANMSGALDTSFIASGEVPLSSISLKGSKGGILLKERTRI